VEGCIAQKMLNVSISLKHWANSK